MLRQKAAKVNRHTMAQDVLSSGGGGSRKKLFNLGDPIKQGQSSIVFGLHHSDGPHSGPQKVLRKNRTKKC